jgi:hypothetical protein
VTAPTRDVHGAALDASRKRAALAAWDRAVAEWREAGQPHGQDGVPAIGHAWDWVLAIYQRYGATVVYDIETPAFVAEGR